MDAAPADTSKAPEGPGKYVSPAVKAAKAKEEAEAKAAAEKAAKSAPARPVSVVATAQPSFTASGDSSSASTSGKYVPPSVREAESQVFTG